VKPSSAMLLAQTSLSSLIPDWYGMAAPVNAYT
jgi:hypothetical protein